MNCASCNQVDHSIMYGVPESPSYKCERYGCIVGMTDKCKGDLNAEKQKEK